MPGADTDGPPAGDAPSEAARSNVILFPGHLRPVVGASAPETENDAARLDRALLELNQALAKQHEAVQAWRQSLETLAGSIGSLVDGLDVLDAGLEAASARLTTDTDENGTKAVKPTGSKEVAASTPEPFPEQPFDPSPH